MTLIAPFDVRSVAVPVNASTEIGPLLVCPETVPLVFRTWIAPFDVRACTLPSTLSRSSAPLELEMSTSVCTGTVIVMSAVRAKPNHGNQPDLRASTRMVSPFCTAE
jgi:hypothetical protein